jgi:tRNA (guanine-N7-)-methyltransferase
MTTRMKYQDKDNGGPSIPTRPRFFGRRKGPSLSDRKQDLIDSLLPRLSLSITKDENTGDESCDLTASFGEKEAYWLEIGFGKGEHLIQQAVDNPNVGLIGCEPYMNGVAGLLTHIEDHNVTNVRVYSDDARHILTALPEASIARIFLIHPDPWPKRRHAQRRFVNKDNLDMFARVLKDGGEFRVGTDHPVYREWTAIQMSARNDFEWTAENKSDWSEKPKDWPETRYETKALEGKATYLIYRRNGRP